LKGLNKNISSVYTIESWLKNEIVSSNVIYVDEASMLSLTDAASIVNHSRNSLYVFCGDSHQSSNLIFTDSLLSYNTNHILAYFSKNRNHLSYTIPITMCEFLSTRGIPAETKNQIKGQIIIRECTELSEVGEIIISEMNQYDIILVASNNIKNVIQMNAEIPVTTIGKAQGTHYKNVIYVQNVQNINGLDIRCDFAYTALTRATNNFLVIQYGNRVIPHREIWL